VRKGEKHPIFNTQVKKGRGAGGWSAKLLHRSDVFGIMAGRERISERMWDDHDE
jgi:hypothetical protein